MKYNAPTGSVDLNAPYVGKNPALGIQGSRVPPKAVEEPQREIVDVITKAGLTPTGDVLQLDDAIGVKIASGGVTDIASARTVISGPVTAPPGSPVAGDEVLVADSPTGAFSANARKLARYNGAAWAFTVCRPGRMFRVNNTDVYWTLHPSSGWVTFTVPIAFVAGLQAALDAKLNLSGGTMTGALLQPVGSAGAPALAAASDTDTGLFYPAANKIALATGGVERVTVDASGNVGVGTSTPAAKLDVNGQSAFGGDAFFGANVGIKLRNAAGVWTGGTAGALILKGGDGTLFDDNYEGDRIFRGAAYAQLFKLAAAGGIGVGPSLDIGTSGKVLAGGTPAAWKTLAELGLGGRKIIDCGMLDSAGSTAITFPSAEPDTSYSAIVFGFTPHIDGTQSADIQAGSVSSKTTSGCTVSASPVGSSAKRIYIIYR